MATGARTNVIYQALGLYTYANQFSAPKGALQTALDVAIDRPGVVESRPAMFNPSGPFLTTGATGLGPISQPSHGADSYAYVNQTALTTTGPGRLSGLSTVYGLWEMASGTRVVRSFPAGTTDNFVGEVTSSFRANGNNFCVSGGKIGSSYSGADGRVYRLDRASGGSISTRAPGAGMPDGLTPVDYTGTAGSGLTGLPTAAGTVLSGVSGGQRAYRIVFATKDLQGNLVRGPPSGRHIVYSTSAYTYGLIVPLPAGQVYAGDIVQVYASEVATAVAGSEPSDNLFQVYEYVVQSADVTAGYVAIQDKAAAGYGPALYTNDTQEGILAAEARPPNCALAVYHKNVAWYGGVAGKGQSAVLSIIGVDGWTTSAGSETQFTIDGTTYKAATAEDLPNHRFKLYTTGSAAQNISATARSLARAISYGNFNVTAYYASPANSIVFQIVIKTAYPGIGGTYTLTTTNAPSTSFVPALPLTLRDDAKTSRLYFSKPSQPEAVPDVNYLSIGGPDFDITGLASLRDSLFVFKTDGLYRVTGTTANDIRIELFDATVKMYPGQFPSIATAGNQIIALCNQGVISVTESGVNVISGPIADIIDSFSSQSVGLGDPASNPAYRLPFPALAAASESGHKYFLVLTDVKNLAFNGQYAQSLYVYNFIRNSWVKWTCPTVCAGVATVMDSSQESVYFTSADRIAMNRAAFNYNSGSGAIAYQSFASFSYCVEDEENPAVLKRFYDVRLVLTQSTGLPSLTCTFSSDSGAAAVPVTQTVSSGQYAVVFQVPREHAQCGQLNFTIAAPSAGRMVVQCCSVSYDVVSDRLPGARG